MRKLSLLLALILLAATPPTISYSQAPALTNEIIWGSPTFFATSLRGIKPMADGLHYTMSGRGALTIDKYEFKSGSKVETLIDSKELKFEGKNLRLQDYTFSNDEKQLLFADVITSIYRHSTSGTYYLLNLEDKNLIKVGENVRLPLFSNNGKFLAYVKENNLFILEIATQSVTQITTDGQQNEIIHGATDWVYEEEFGFERAFYWSKEDTYLAWLRFDESRVKEFSFNEFNGNLYPTNYTFKYPKAGEENAIVTAHYYDVTKGKRQQIDLGNTDDLYLPGLKFSDVDHELCILRLNRLQNHLEYLLVNLKENSTPRVILEDKSDTYVYADHSFSFTQGNKGLIFTSERSGFKNVYMLNPKSGKITPVVSGSFDVKEIYGTDGNALYYRASEGSPLNEQVFRINLNGKGKKLISPFEGNSKALFSDSFKYWFLTHSTANVPPSIKVMDNQGKLIKIITENENVSEAAKRFELQPKEFFNITTEKGVDINAFIIKPNNFDATKKYPVLVTLYNGPGHNFVKNEWAGANLLWHQLLAQKDIIVIGIDGRGTGNRGKDFRAVTYKELGKYETIDLIDATKEIGKFPYVNAQKIGVQGWSYGGFMALLGLTKGADVFACGISVAPVTSWRYYDTIYTERYMRTPQENPGGYDENSPINHVKKLKDNTLLLIHGTADDNVHVQNAMEITNALIDANKQFEQFMYPDRNHGIYGGNTRIHLYNLMTDFLERKLLKN
ncbi:MAG: DPP IV N-terminal domain-containing protein [Luteibaculaceae bacterium]